MKVYPSNPGKVWKARRNGNPLKKLGLDRFGEMERFCHTYICVGAGAHDRARNFISPFLQTFPTPYPPRACGCGELWRERGAVAQGTLPRDRIRSLAPCGAGASRNPVSLVGQKVGLTGLTGLTDASAADAQPESGAG